MDRGKVSLNVATGAFLLMTFSVSAPQPAQSHPLNEIHPINTGFNMSERRIFNVSTITLDEGDESEGLVFDNLTITHEGEAQKFVLDYSNDQWDVVNSNLSLEDNYLLNHYDSSCQDGEAVLDINNDGSFNCFNVTVEVSDQLVNESGDTMTGELTVEDWVNVTQNLNVSNGALYVDSSTGDVEVQSGNLNMTGGNDVDLYGGKVYDSQGVLTLGDGNVEVPNGKIIASGGNIDLSNNDLESVEALDSDGSNTNIDLKDGGSIELPDGHLNISSGNINMSFNNITSIDTLKFQQGMTINGSINTSGGDANLDNGDINDVKSIDGGGDSVRFDDSIDLNGNSLLNYFAKECGKIEAVKKIYDNGTVKCGQAATGLPTVLGIDNEANMTLNMSSDDIERVGNLSFSDSNADLGSWRVFEESSGNGDLQLQYNGNERLLVTKNGVLRLQNGDLDLDGNNLDGVNSVNPSGDLEMFTDGSGSGSINFKDSSSGDKIMLTLEETGPMEFRNPISGNDILRMNASGGSGVEIPNGDLTVDGSDLYVDSTNSRVGIGTSSPGLTLTVDGDAKIKGSLDVVGPINTTSKQNLEVNSSIVPPQGYSGQFNIGNSTRQWKNANFTNTGFFGSGLTVAGGSVKLPTGEVGNAELANSDLTISAGRNLSGGKTISLGGSMTIKHEDTSSQSDMELSNGEVVQDVLIGDSGHVTTLRSKNLDNRYYKESESDSNFVDEGSTDVDGWSVEFSSDTLSVPAGGVNSSLLDESHTYSLNWSELDVERDHVTPSDVDLASLSTDSSLSGSSYDGTASRTFGVNWGDADNLNSSGAVPSNTIGNSRLRNDVNIDLGTLDVSGGSVGDGTQSGFSVDSSGNVYFDGSLNFPGEVNTINAQEVNGSFIPERDNKQNLGNSTNRWKDIYTAGSLIMSGTDLTESNLDALNDGVIADGEVNNDLTLGTSSTITLSQGTSVSPTTEGRVRWDTDNDKLKVGNGGSTTTLTTESSDTTLTENEVESRVFDTGDNNQGNLGMNGNSISSVQKVSLSGDGAIDGNSGDMCIGDRC
ncbi:MAG: hypothetical protein ABEJ56_06945 [Candidatus Nanohaloarchaea archaeon]